MSHLNYNQIKSILMGNFVESRGGRAKERREGRDTDGDTSTTIFSVYNENGEDSEEREIRRNAMAT